MAKIKGSPAATPASRPKTARRHETNTKRRGELSELAFVYKAAGLGFGVAKPYGDSERYDFILDVRSVEAEETSLNDALPETAPESDPREPGSREDRSPDRPTHRLWRVQVKSTTTLLNGQYRINAHRRIYGRAVPYQPSEVDFLVAYIIPEDAWFILPIRAILGRTSLLFAPRNFPRPGLYAAYREAWHLLRKP